MLHVESESVPLGLTTDVIYTVKGDTTSKRVSAASICGLSSFETVLYHLNNMLEVFEVEAAHTEVPRAHMEEHFIIELLMH